MNLHDGRRRKSLFELPIRKSQSRSARCRCPLGIESGKTRSMRRRRAPLTASEFRHHYAIAAVNGWNHVATEFHTGMRAPHHKASNGVARLRIGGCVTAHQPEIR
jgi:hypothetical protein